jgi:flavin-dependent dehydrogenase
MIESEHWDAIIVGAGPAGAFAAYLLAQNSARVLLVDKANFPRAKVCGCCINAAAINILETHSLAHIFKEHGAIPIRSLQLFDQGEQAKVNLPGGFALSRNKFDYSLIQAAVDKGATFMPETAAIILDPSATGRGVQLQRHTGSIGLADASAIGPKAIDAGAAAKAIDAGTAVAKAIDARAADAEAIDARAADAEAIDARAVQAGPVDARVVNASVVLVADGIGGHSLNRIKDFDFITDANSRFGCGTIIDDAPDFYETGSIYMVCGHDGYVGLVRLEDGRVDIAAALDREFSKKHSGPGGAAVSILNSSNMPIPPLLSSAHWNGTEALTRRRKRIADERVFVIGDACGYAEPFTGEGIAWALASAVGAARLARTAIKGWSESLASSWAYDHRQLLKHRQTRSIFIAHALRRDAVRHLIIPAIATFPSIANFIAQKVSQSGVTPIAPSERHTQNAAH